MALSHRELIVWQRSMTLAVEVYRLTDDFPRTEQYRLVSQLTRATVSVPANIAEGNGRDSLKAYVHFLCIARGSLMETETLLMLAERLGYVDADRAVAILDEVTQISRMLITLRRRLQRR